MNYITSRVSAQQFSILTATFRLTCAECAHLEVMLLSLPSNKKKHKRLFLTTLVFPSPHSSQVGYDLRPYTIWSKDTIHIRGICSLQHEQSASGTRETERVGRRILCINKKSNRCWNKCIFPDNVAFSNTLTSHHLRDLTYALALARKDRDFQGDNQSADRLHDSKIFIYLTGFVIVRIVEHWKITPYVNLLIRRFTIRQMWCG